MATLTFDRITVNPGQCDGKPCICGLRIPVRVILRLLFNGKTPEEVIADFPEVCAADIKQAMEYAAWLASEKTIMVSVWGMNVFASLKWDWLKLKTSK